MFVVSAFFELPPAEYCTENAAVERQVDSADKEFDTIERGHNYFPLRPVEQMLDWERVSIGFRANQFTNPSALPGSKTLLQTVD